MGKKENEKKPAEEADILAEETVKEPAAVTAPEAGPAEAPAASKKEPVFTVDELAASHKAFDASPDMVRAAFAVARKTTATRAEAVKIIEAFKAMEV